MHRPTDLLQALGFEGWPVPALLLDAESATLLAATRASLDLFAQPEQSLVGRSLADLFGMATAAPLTAGNAFSSIRAVRPDGRPLYLLARCLPSATNGTLLVFFEDVTELWLGRATAQAMAGVVSARADAVDVDDYAQRCVEALVVAGLATKAAILQWPESHQPMPVRGSLGWSADELAVLAATPPQIPPFSTDVQAWSSTIAAATCIATDDGPAQVGFVPLTHGGKLAGVLVLQPFSQWMAAPGHEFLERAIEEGLTEALLRLAARSEPAGHLFSDAAAAAEALDVLIHTATTVDPNMPSRERVKHLLEALRILVPFDQVAVLGKSPDAEGLVTLFTYPPGEDALPEGASIVSSEEPFFSAAMSGQIISDRLRPGAGSEVSRTLQRAGIGPWAVIPLAGNLGPACVLLVTRRGDGPDFAPDELRLLHAAARLVSCALAEKQSAVSRGRQEARAARGHQTALAHARLETAQMAAGFFMSHLEALETALEEALQASRGTRAEDAVVRATAVLQRCLDESARVDACWDRSPDDGLEPVSLAEVVSQAVQAVAREREAAAASAFTAYHIVTESTTEGRILGRRDRLMEATRALLENAFQAMPHGGRLTARVDQCGSWIRLLVADTGAGIAPALWDSLYEPFFTTFGMRHAGLGLTLVDAVVAKHKGIVLVCSDVQEGTTFAVYLPAVPEGS